MGEQSIKSYSLPLTMVSESVETSRKEREVCYNLIEGMMESKEKNFLELEAVFECFTVNSKIVRELETKALENPIRRDPNTNEEHVVISTTDLQIMEALFLARYYVQKELKEILNVSVLLH